MNYYNENDPASAAWLDALIDAGEIAYGVVDTRSIEDVLPSDLEGFTQCHFFAGIGVWSLALRQAGWPDDRPVWTGSCPCQPFSAAGKGGGFTDERHLWPSWFHLIQVNRPDVVFGEQVASKDGLAWLDLVSTDMDNARYAFAAVDLCSAGFGSADIRQRLYFSGVADTYYARLEGRGREIGERERQIGSTYSRGPTSRMADSTGERWSRRQGTEKRCLDDRSYARRQQSEHGTLGFREGGVEWIPCTDGFWRPVESGSFPLVNGVAGRMGRLRGYGNAVNRWAATTFISSFLESEAAGFAVLDQQTTEIVSAPKTQPLGELLKDSGRTFEWDQP